MVQFNSQIRPSGSPTAPTGINPTGPVQTPTAPEPPASDPTPRPVQDSSPIGLTTQQITVEVNQALQTGGQNLQGPEAEQRFGHLQQALPQLAGSPETSGSPPASEPGSVSPVGQQSTTSRNEARQSFSEGEAAMNSGDLTGAEEAFRRTLHLLPAGQQSPSTLFNLGACLEEQGRTREAADFFRQYLALAPSNEQEGIQHAQEIVRLSDQAPTSRNGARQSFREGQAAYNRGDIAGAGAAFQQTLNQLPPPIFTVNTWKSPPAVSSRASSMPANRSDWRN